MIEDPKVELTSHARAVLDAVRVQALADHDILVRLDEKVSALHGRFDDFQNDLKAHEERDAETYVTQETFNATIDPIKRLSYGAVGTVLTAVLVAILALVLQ